MQGGGSLRLKLSCFIISSLKGGALPTRNYKCAQTLLVHVVSRHSLHCQAELRVCRKQRQNRGTPEAVAGFRLVEASICTQIVRGSAVEPLPTGSQSTSIHLVSAYVVKRRFQDTSGLRPGSNEVLSSWLAAWNVGLSGSAQSSMGRKPEWR